MSWYEIEVNLGITSTALGFDGDTPESAKHAFVERISALLPYNNPWNRKITDFMWDTDRETLWISISAQFDMRGTEEENAQSVAKKVWYELGFYGQLEIRLYNMESLPYKEFVFEEEEYKEIMGE